MISDSVLYILILFLNVKICVKPYELPIYSRHSSEHLQHPRLSVMSPHTDLMKKKIICYMNIEQNLCRFNSNFIVKTTSLSVKRKSLQQHSSNKYNNFKSTMNPEIDKLKTNMQGLLSYRLFTKRPTFNIQRLRPPTYNISRLNELYNSLIHQEKFTENTYKLLNYSVQADNKGNFFVNDKNISIIKSFINHSVSKDFFLKNISESIRIEDKNISEAIPMENKNISEAILMEDKNISEAISMENKNISEAIPMENENISEAIPMEDKNISEAIPIKDDYKNRNEKITADFFFKRSSEKIDAYATNYNNSENKLPTEVLPESTPSMTQDQEVFSYAKRKQSLFDYFTRTLDDFERKFYNATFTKLSSISSAERQENGISFVQSGLFLYMFLISLSTTVDVNIKAEIDQCTGFIVSDTERIEIITQIESQLPKSNDDLKFRWSSRLVLKSPLKVSEKFRTQTAVMMQLHIDQINETETPDLLYKSLNRMVEIDSGGAMHDTFEEDELSEGICTVLLTTMYLRGRWRSAPTLLNGTWPFRDVDGTPPRSARMIRINDIMLYADLNEWDAEAIEISYATPGLTLLVLVPKGRSLRKLASLVADTSVHNITQRMHSVRVAAILPLYTLRMTLLLPNKLQNMGINRLVDINSTHCTDLRVSHAVQRLMFWAEPGRNAFKDDGIEWDEPPEMELMVDRPYIFFVRWYNITLMNGNFVL